MQDGCFTDFPAFAACASHSVDFVPGNGITGFAVHHVIHARLLKLFVAGPAIVDVDKDGFDHPYSKRYNNNDGCTVEPFPVRERSQSDALPLGREQDLVIDDEAAEDGIEIVHRTSEGNFKYE